MKNQIKGQLNIEVLLAALESAANAIMITDKIGIILWANNAFFKSTGYKAEEIIGKNTNILKSNQHDSIFFSALWNTIMSGKPWTGEIINKRKDGSLYIEEMTIMPINDNNNITHFIAIKQDLTDKKIATLELKNREAQYRNILNNTHDLIFAFSDEGTLFYANPAFLSILEYDENEIQNLSIYSIISKDSLHIFESFIKNNLIRTNNKLIEISFISKTNKAIFAEGKLIPYVTNGKLISIWATFTDLTNKKQIELMRNEFISMITHDIKTPLSSIKSVLSLLPTNYYNSKELFNIAKINVDRLSRLAESLLDVAILENNNYKINLVPIQIVDIVNSAIQLYQELAAEKQISLLLSVTDKDSQNNVPQLISDSTIDGARVIYNKNSSCSQVKILADEDKFMQILSNLLSNAIKFSYPASEIKVNITINKPNIKIAITNFGQSIHPEIKDKIFQKVAKFYSSPSTTGAGLGLYICKLLTDKMNGKISFTSDNINGTTFFIEFPIYIENNTNPLKILTNSPDSFRSDTNEYENLKDYPPLQKILIIDDDKDIQKIIKLALELLGNFTTEICDSPNEAIQKALSFAPDLILLDEVMPLISGIELIKIIRNQPQLCQIPAIFISAKLNQNDLEKLKTFRIISIISKPFDPNVLHKIILNSWMNYHKTKNNIGS